MLKRALLVVVATGVVVLPMLVVSEGADPFRLPKELLFRAEGIVLLALLVLRALRWRPEFTVAAAIVAWTAIVTATSTNRALSVDSLITVVAAAVIFIATCAAAETRSLEAVDALMIGCCVNAAITILQELGVWTLTPGMKGHYGAVGLLGNANDAGTFLVAPAVAAVVMTVIAAGRRRWIYLGISLLLVSGMVASATRTALIAFVAAMLVLAMLQTRRAALAIGAVLLVAGLAVLSPATTLGRSMRDLGSAAIHRDYQRLFSERLLPFLAAAEMARDHPLLGVGPGAFKYHFMAYRLGLASRYPPEWTRGFPMNWGAVHNDHLQVAAETGAIGSLLFLLALGMLAKRPAPVSEEPRVAFARALRWPLATAIFVVCLAQFPLELAAPRLMFLTLAALCVTWTARPTPSVATSNTRRLVLATIATAAAFIGIVRLCVIPFRDNLIMRDLERRSATADSVDPAAAAPLAHANLADFARIARSHRLDPQWYMLYGANCELLERWPEAADSYTRALTIDQRPEIYFSRGLVLLHLGQVDRATADMVTAVRFNPFLIDGIDGDLRARVASAAGLR
jgi:putative inorganic carbon (HCO3(-)) transporter